MPKGREDEENNYFNHFGLGVDKKTKEKSLRSKLPPKPPAKESSASGQNSLTAGSGDQKSGANAAGQKKLVDQGLADGKSIDDVKSTNKNDAANNLADKNAAADKDKQNANQNAGKDIADNNKDGGKNGGADEDKKKPRYRDSTQENKDWNNDAKARKDRENKFMSWVTNGREDDIHHCESVLFA